MNKATQVETPTAKTEGLNGGQRAAMLIRQGLEIAARFGYEEDRLVEFFEDFLWFEKPGTEPSPHRIGWLGAMLLAVCDGDLEKAKTLGARLERCRARTTRNFYRVIQKVVGLDVGTLLIADEHTRRARCFANLVDRLEQGLPILYEDPLEVKPGMVPFAYVQRGGKWVFAQD